MGITAVAIFGVWIFALGAIIGSFLNVVIYRLPAGKSLVFPGSRCPNCLSPIRWHDNLPIFSWFILGGKCRDCRAAISVRYPLVEAATALMFLSVAYVHFGVTTVAGDRGAIAKQVDSAEEGVLWAGDPGWPIKLSRSVRDWFLLSTLLAGSVIVWDGRRVPWQLFAPVLIGGMTVALAEPWLNLGWRAHPMRGIDPIQLFFSLATDLAVGVAILVVVGIVLGDSASRGLGWAIISTTLIVGWKIAIGAAVVGFILSTISWVAYRILRAENPGFFLPWFSIGVFASVVVEPILQAVF